MSLWASVVLTWLGAVSFHRFDEPAAGWALAALGACYLVASSVYAVTRNVRGMVMWGIAFTLIVAVTLGRNATIGDAYMLRQAFPNRDTTTQPYWPR